MKDFLSKHKRKIGIAALVLVLLVGAAFVCQATLDPLDNRIAAGEGPLRHGLAEPAEGTG